MHLSISPSIRAAFSRTWTRFNAIPWSLGFALGLMAWMAPHLDWHTDLALYRGGINLPYPYWTNWILAPLRVLPAWAAYLVLCLCCLALLYFAVRIFGGRHWVVFTSFALGWNFFYGQVDGLVVGGLALAAWALQKNRPYWMGIGLILASIKPQVSLPLMIALWWWSPNKIKPLVIPAVVAGLSFLQWGFWLPTLLNQFLHDHDLTQLTRNVSWWQVLGPWSLLVWLPVILARLPRQRKIVAIAAATAFCMPYFPAPSTLLLLVLPIPVWGYLLAQLPLLSGLGDFWIYEWMKILPTSLVIWALWPALLTWALTVKSRFFHP